MMPAEIPKEMQQMHGFRRASRGDLWIKGQMSESAENFYGWCLQRSLRKCSKCMGSGELLVEIYGLRGK
jgi:hypothetical protein